MRVGASASGSSTEMRTPEFWMNAQRAVDLYDAKQALKDTVARIKPLRVA